MDSQNLLSSRSIRQEESPKWQPDGNKMVECSADITLENLFDISKNLLIQLRNADLACYTFLVGLNNI